MENRKSKNWWGGLWFIPAIYTSGRWVLSMIGDAQTAYSVFQTQWITIDWVVVSHLMAMVGVWWLICVNWDLIRRWKNKYPRNDELVPINEALAILVLDENIKGNHQKYKDALNSVREAAQNGKIVIWVHERRGSFSYLKSVPKNFWKHGGGIGMTETNDTLSVTIRYTPSGADKYDQIFITQRDILKLDKIKL